MNKDLIHDIFNNIDHPKDCYTMGSICRNFNQVYQDNRYGMLRQSIINHLRCNDKNFMNHMKQFKKIMSTKGAKYFDNRSYRTHDLENIIIVVRLIENKIILAYETIGERE